jgi:hypothetical protein
MRLTKFFLSIFLTVVPFLSLNAQNINGRITSSVYAFERAYSLTDSDMFLRGYESLVLNINKDNYSLRTRMNFETNFGDELVGDPRLRLYNLYFEARKVLKVATVKLGRQPIFNQVAGGLFDGANVKLKISDFTVQGYFGGNVPAYQDFDITDDWSNNRIFGGKVNYNGLQNVKIGLSYIDKNYTPIDYEAQRLDINLNPITVLIQDKSNQFRYGTATVSYIGLLDLNARVNYDFNFQQLSKAEFCGRYDDIKNLGINIYYNYRAPQIRYNSIFAVFNFGNTQEIEAGLDYKINNDFKVYGKFGNVEYEDDNSQRMTIGLNTSYGSANFRKTFGYAGELSSVSLYTSHSMYNGLITPSVGLAFTNYKLSEDDEANDIISALAGVNVRPWRTLSFDLQGQFSDNKIYKNDLRLFFKINYWFNTNLDLL